MFFRVLVVLVAVAVATAFHGSRMHNRAMQMSMSAGQVNKVLSAAAIATSILATPAFAKEGAGAKIGIFSNDAVSSPFAFDDAYSPYSPYSTGEKAVYKARKGSAEEIAFYNKKFEECK